jgi:hypothetical protein
MQALRHSLPRRRDRARRLIRGVDHSRCRRSGGRFYRQRMPLGNVRFLSGVAKGAVHMAVEDALSGEDKTDGYILACQAEITGGVVIDA